MTRARIVLLAAAGWTNRAIARKLGLAPNTVTKWRKRFWKEGLDGLGDRKRPGRPRAFQAAVVTACKAIACELPATRGVPLGRWSLAELRTQVLATGLVDDVSTTTLWRWLAEDPIKPWQHRSWSFPRCPRLGCQGRCRPRPLPAGVRWRGARRRRGRRQRRPEDLHPGPLPLPPHLPPGWRGWCGSSTRRAGPSAGGSGGLGGAPGPAVRPLRAVDRHRALRQAGGAGHDRRAVRLGQAGVLGGRQRQLAPRAGGGGAAGGHGATCAWSTCPSTPGG